MAGAGARPPHPAGGQRPGNDGGRGAARRGVRFQRSFAAGDRATRTVLAELIAALAGQGVATGDLRNLELILAEVLNNIAEHAYAGQGGPVELLVERRGDGLACRIADRGQPMPGNDAPDPPLPSVDPPDTLPEGGFGWHIIRCLTSDLTYRRADGWNMLTLTLPWATEEV